MIKNFKPSHVESSEHYCVEFDIDDTGGFSFPCDKNGAILRDKMTPEAVANYQDCLAHPERFIRSNILRDYSHSYTVPAEGDCRCGAHIELYNQYMGACSCPNCHQWYSLSGQELIPPQYWED